MIKGKYSLYVALLKAFHYYSFTMKEAGLVQKENLGPLWRGSWYYTNANGELHRFIQEGRAQKIARGVYRLTPRDKDVDICMKAVAARPGSIMEADHRDNMRNYVKLGITSWTEDELYIPKRPRKPVMVYSIVQDAFGPHVIGNAAKLLTYYGRDLTGPQRDAVLSGREGKWVGTIDVIARIVL